MSGKTEKYVAKHFVGGFENANIKETLTYCHIIGKDLAECLE